MNLKLEYESQLDKLDKYPKYSRPWCYVLGLVGESAEFMEKYLDTKNNREALIKELGDIIWYLTRFTNHLKLDSQKLLREARLKQFRSLPQNDTITIFVNTGKIAETIKKAIRDKNSILDESDLTNIKFKLINIYSSIDRICDSLEITYEEAAQKNLEKLLDRLARNKIGGSGDTR